MRDHNTVFRNVLQKRDDYESKKKSLKKINFRYLGLAAACMVLVTVLAIGIPIMLSKKDAVTNNDFLNKENYSGSKSMPVDEIAGLNGESDMIFNQEESVVFKNGPEEPDYHSEDAVSTTDWPYYDSTEELITSSTDIFTGKIIGVGRAVRGDIQYVVYKLSVSKVYKGQYEETQSLEIPASESGVSVDIGEEYLFLTVKSTSGVLCVVNIDQYAYRIDSDEAKDIIDSIK